jgi:hypothetical protein
MHRRNLHITVADRGPADQDELLTELLTEPRGVIRVVA